MIPDRKRGSSKDTGALPLNHRIAATLKARILRGDYAPADLLPSERTLMSEFGVSRVTVKSALKRLSDDGHIVIRPGVGSEVIGQVDPIDTKSRTLTIALIWTDKQDSSPLLHQYASVDTVRSEVESDRYHLMVHSFDESEPDERVRLEALLDRVDGVILRGIHRSWSVNQCRQRNVPTVLLFPNCLVVGVDTFSVDERLVGVLAAEHLLDRSHKKIAVIAGPRETATANERVDGALSVLRAHGVDLNDVPIVWAENWSMNAGIAAMRELSAIENEFTAIIAGNDALAIGARSTLADGYDTPSVSLVGCDNIKADALLDSAVDSVDLFSDYLARRAARRLLERIDDPELPFEQTIVSPRLVEHGSVADLTVDGFDREKARKSMSDSSG